LLTLKTLAKEYVSTNAIPRLSPLAVELGMATPLQIIDIPVKEGNHPAAHYYDHMLELCEKMFDNELDPAQFEEYLRYMWGTKAFPLFTVDKLCYALIKHVRLYLFSLILIKPCAQTHTVNNDAICQDMMLLLERDRKRDQTTIKQQIAYRMEVEAMLPEDDSLYRVEWVRQSLLD
jgi:paired amphipathic helix protein Sin3a